MPGPHASSTARRAAVGNNDCHVCAHRGFPSRSRPAGRPARAGARARCATGGVQILTVLQSSDELLPELLELAHAVRMKWCGPEVEVEGIVSLKTGGCPEDCHFCSQSGQFTSPVRSVWLNIPELVKAAEQTARHRRQRVLHRRRRARPRRAADEPDARGREGDQGGRRHRGRRLAGHADPGAGRRPGRHGRAPLQPQPRGRPLLLPAGRDHALLGGALGHLPDGPRLRHGAVLRLPGRHGRDRRAARRAGRPARPSSSPTRCR